MELKEGETSVRIQGTNSLFDGKYATVMKVYKDGDPEGPIGVNFGAYYSWIFGAGFKKNGIVRFQEGEMKVVPEMPLEVRAMNLFKGMCMATQAINGPLDETKPCMHEGCAGKRERRGLVNVWGVVQEFDACKGHYVQYHGHNVDEFPFRKD
ncbi:hypothetical protein M1432_01970 [Patescibacteria group bacterium]|nr:hypothetical protein [Patescibacteria group bacterium]